MLFIGMVIGAIFGMFAFALCKVSGDADEAEKWRIKNE